MVKALDYFSETGIIPFIIYYLINLPMLGGFELEISLKVDERIGT